MTVSIALICRIDATNPRDFAEALADHAAIDLSVITDSDNYERSDCIDQSAIYHFQPTWPTNIARIRPQDRKRYQDILGQIDPDIVLATGMTEITFMHFNSDAPPTVYLPQGGEMQKALGSPYWSDSSLLATLNYLTYRPLMWDLLRNVNEVWTGDPNRELMHELGLPKGRFNVFDWGVVDTELFKPKDDYVSFGDDSPETIIGTFRRIRGNSLFESYETFIDAIRVLKERRTDFHVVIGGFYEDNRENDTVKLIERKIERYNLDSFVTRLEMVPKEELPRYYSGLDVYLNPTHKDIELSGLGTASKEAMACECAYVSFDQPPKDHDISHGENGFLVEHGDPQGLADIFDSLCDWDENVSKMCKNARELILEKYSEEAVTNRTVNEVRRIIRKN